MVFILQNYMRDLMKLYTIKQVCSLLEVGKTTAFALIKNKKLKSVKIGKSTRITDFDLNNFICDLRNEFTWKI